MSKRGWRTERTKMVGITLIKVQPNREGDKEQSPWFLNLKVKIVDIDLNQTKKSTKPPMIKVKNEEATTLPLRKNTLRFKSVFAIKTEGQEAPYLCPDINRGSQLSPP